jgi:pimeloyl-ACP methyl ester carboxylesterase
MRFGMKLALFSVGALLTQANEYTNPDWSLWNDLLHTVPGGEKYDFERHPLTTEDGYKINIMRMVPKVASTETRRPVFVQHGVASNGLNWVAGSIETNPSITVALAEAGYDVWIGNNRGNLWSLEHETLTWEDREYWNYGWAEMGLYDMPAAIHHIYDTTGERVNYFGFSQGTSQLFYGLSKLWHTDLPFKFERVMATAPCFVIDQNAPFFLINGTPGYWAAEALAESIGIDDFLFGPKDMDPTLQYKIITAMSDILMDGYMPDTISFR